MNSITIKAHSDKFPAVEDYIESELKKRNISNEIILETLLVFEAIYDSIIGQVPDGTEIKVSLDNAFGKVRIKIDYIGKMYVRDISYDEYSPEKKIMEAYNDKISSSYHASRNHIRLSVKRGPYGTALWSAFWMILALIVCLVLRMFRTTDDNTALLSNYIFPLEHAYSNLMTMVGAPITFLTLLSNLTDTYVLSSESSLSRILQRKSYSTSLLSILISIIIFHTYQLFIGTGFGKLSSYAATTSFIDLSFSGFLEDSFLDNFFDPFLSTSPIPLIIVSLIIVYSFCVSETYIEPFKKFVDSALTVLSKMINPLMYVIPFFSFLAVIDVVLVSGFSILIEGGIIYLVMLSGIAAMLLFYIIRLMIAGVKVADFTRKLIPSIRENFIINSTPDAVPYNIRYCTKAYGIKRSLLDESLPILSKINLDGNCFVVMFFALLLAYLTGLHLSIGPILMISFVVFFLSIGAPNPPGSIFIATLIILKLLNLPDMVSLCIISEILIGPIQNFINYVGDIVTVVIINKETSVKAE